MYVMHIQYEFSFAVVDVEMCLIPPPVILMRRVDFKHWFTATTTSTGEIVPC